MPKRRSESGFPVAMEMDLVPTNAPGFLDLLKKKSVEVWKELERSWWLSVPFLLEFLSNLVLSLIKLVSAKSFSFRAQKIKDFL